MPSLLSQGLAQRLQRAVATACMRPIKLGQRRIAIRSKFLEKDTSRNTRKESLLHAPSRIAEPRLSVAKRVLRTACLSFNLESQRKASIAPDADVASQQMSSAQTDGAGRAKQQLRSKDFVNLTQNNEKDVGSRRENMTLSACTASPLMNCRHALPIRMGSVPFAVTKSTFWQSAADAWIIVTRRSLSAASFASSAMLVLASSATMRCSSLEQSSI